MTLRYFADANFPLPLVQEIRGRGRFVDRFVHTASSVDDRAMMRHAWAGKLVILTQDNDFLRLALEERVPTLGVVLLRLKQEGKWRGRAIAVAETIISHEPLFHDAVCILSPDGVERTPLAP